MLASWFIVSCLLGVSLSRTSDSRSAIRASISMSWTICCGRLMTVAGSHGRDMDDVISTSTSCSSIVMTIGHAQTHAWVCSVWATGTSCRDCLSAVLYIQATLLEVLPRVTTTKTRRMQTRPSSADHGFQRLRRSYDQDLDGTRAEQHLRIRRQRARCLSHQDLLNRGTLIQKHKTLEKRVASVVSDRAQRN